MKTCGRADLVPPSVDSMATALTHVIRHSMYIIYKTHPHNLPFYFSCKIFPAPPLPWQCRCCSFSSTSTPAIISSDIIGSFIGTFEKFWFDLSSCCSLSLLLSAWLTSSKRVHTHTHTHEQSKVRQQ